MSEVIIRHWLGGWGDGHLPLDVLPLGLVGCVHQINSYSGGNSGYRELMLIRKNAQLSWITMIETASACIFVAPKLQHNS
jgi:hypothetical protein